MYIYVMAKQAIVSGKTMNVSIPRTKYMLVTTAISVIHTWRHNGLRNG